MDPDQKFMRKAIALSVQNIGRGGGPFGAVVVRDGKVVSTGVNRVTHNNDPTAHAEVNAIRKAALKLKSFDLSGCTIYTSCEPCPMCLGAIYWARIDRIFYGNTRTDAKNIDFSDSFIYDEMAVEPGKRKLEEIPLLREEAQAAFDLWKRHEGKIRY